jgi:hypothetical protein
LVDDYVLEEALYREGVAMGVDKDDTVIRRRVRQKMEFVVEDVVEVTEPPEAELEAWLAEHPGSYRRPTRLSLRQVYLSPDQRGDRLRVDADRLLAELRAGGDSDASTLGDSTLLGFEHENVEADMAVRSFGKAFVEQLDEMPTGQWSGPIESSFGLHLVIIDDKIEGELPSLAEVRDAVTRDWSYAQRQEASKRFYDEVLSRYRITIQWPNDVSAAQAADTQGPLQ